MEPEGSLPCSQGPAAGLCPDPDESSPHVAHAVSLRSILILSCCPFPSGFIKILYACCDKHTIRVTA